MKKKTKKKLDFSQKLAQKLRELGKVEEDAFSDNSGKWVNIRIKNSTLTFGFDMKGENIDSIHLYKDKVIIESEQVWGKYK